MGPSYGLLTLFAHRNLGETRTLAVACSAGASCSRSPHPCHSARTLHPIGDHLCSCPHRCRSLEAPPSLALSVDLLPSERCLLVLAGSSQRSGETQPPSHSFPLRLPFSPRSRKAVWVVGVAHLPRPCPLPSLSDVRATPTSNCEKPMTPTVRIS